ncbi:MAG: LysR family transcriptional regulator [Candidatus Rokuibacteriota bacterium]|nr:MAG: LysR family transcriptional regulator [Candidatus Rokubacteria bacterium]
MLIAVEIDQVQAFVAIVRGGGFTRAASILHLSQPAVSRRLDLLERELGAPLFERIRSGVILTEAGRTFLPHAEGLLACMRDGLDSVRALHQVDRGTITLALVGTLASTTLTACLERFREAHPRVELRLRTALSQEVSVLVRRGDATLGLRYGADPHPEMLATPIYDEPMMVVCSPRHRLARHRRVAPSALGAERWVAFPPRSDAFYDPYPWSLQNRLAAWGLSPAEIIPIDSLTAQKRMVEAGFGLALLPESSVDEELRTGTLRAMRISGTRVTIPVLLIHRRRAYLSGAARALMAELAAWPSRQTPPRGVNGSGRRLPRGARKTAGRHG